jgi:hypothetical protein
MVMLMSEPLLPLPLKSSVVPVPQFVTAALTQGLVGYWPLDGAVPLQKREAAPAE